MVESGRQYATILINYNNLSDTRLCLDAVYRTSDPDNKIIVVDNASNEEGIEELLAEYPDAILLKNEENLGFGRANNIGIRWALSNTDCEYVFILNNDTTIESDTVSRLVAALEDNSEVGISCPRIVMMDDPDMLWYGGGWIDWRKGAAIIPGYLGPADAELALSARYVSFASGCAMLIRRSILEKIGGFDPRLFMYMEDLELCLRVREAGWTIRYVPEAVVMHKGQGSLRKDGNEFFPIQHPRNPRLDFFMYHITKNRLLTMFIYTRGWNAVMFWSFFPIYQAAKCVQFAFHGRWTAVKAVAQGVRDFSSARKQLFVNELEEEFVIHE